MNEGILRFVKKIVLVSLPIVIQQLFLNLASLLDTLMVGQLDEASISGVYVATQIIFVVNLMIFGSIEGATVYYSQFFGIKDKEKMRNAFAFKLVASVIIAFIATFGLLIFGKDLASLFLSSSLEIDIAVSYINIVALSFIPFAITVSISSTMRESHNGLPPTIVTVIGVISNLIFNYIFIYGKMGAPALGGSGAAIGTFVNRIVEFTILVILLYKKKYDFSINLFHNFKMERSLLKNIIIKTIPLFFNEILWSLSQTVLVFFFTQNDQIATTVLPIVTTISNLLFVVLLGLGNGYSIVVGNTIGENKIERAQKEAYITLLMTTISCIFLGLTLILTSDFIVSLYSGINNEAKELASYLIKFNGIYILINGINTNLFFLLRAGGRTGVVFFFDSFYGWLISIPFIIILSNFTTIPLKDLYVLIYSIDIIKALFGFILLFAKKWCKNLTMLEKSTN